jgi:hypothetical protein
MILRNLKVGVTTLGHVGYLACRTQHGYRLDAVRTFV